VLVDSSLPQLDRLLDYRIPEGMAGVVPGVRVSVPLRAASRIAEGFVVELGSQQDYPGPLSDLAALVSPVPVLQPEVWALARAVADRAAGSAGDVLRLAIPPRQVRVEKAWLARGEQPERAVIQPPAFDDYAPGDLEAALSAGERLALGVSPGVAPAGLDGAWIGRWALTLARAAARVVAAGASAIVVAPDYRDQEQLGAALGTLLPADAVVRLDARQSNPDRYRGMLRAIGAAPLVLLGNRSAIYAPAARLGLIAIWNDGDPLLGEPLSPYVHARDAALVRQEQQGGALVFAGHTRTTEVERLVEVGYLRELRPARPRHPRVIPTANIAAQDRLAAQARIPSIAWREATAGSKTGPVLVQVARPGYSPGLRCADCGESARCRVCGGPLHQKRAGGIPTCSWCGAPDASWRCANCQSMPNSGSIVMGNAAASLGMPAIVALLLGLLAGLATGVLNGLLVTRLNLPPFIVTLGTLSIFTALTLLISNGATVQGNQLPDILTWTGLTVRVFGVDITYGVILMIVVYLIAAFALGRTSWGRHVYAVGDDKEAARLTGIRVSRVLLSVYITAGVVVALTAWIQIGRDFGSSPNAAVDANLNAITAVVIGGTSLFGGRGNVWGTLLGALIVGVFRNGLALAGLDVLYQTLAVGVLVIVAVSIDQWIRKVRK